MESDGVLGQVIHATPLEADALGVRLDTDDLHGLGSAVHFPWETYGMTYLFDGYCLHGQTASCQWDLVPEMVHQDTLHA